VHPLDEDFPGIHNWGSQFIAKPLWDIRQRLELLKEQLPLLSYGARAADTIAWGVMNRVGSEMGSFTEPLADALSKDSDSFDKLFHYEILAAFAWHGIRLEPGIAVIQPHDFVVDGRTGGSPILAARAFLGENTVYIAEFSTNPNAFGFDPLNLYQQPDPDQPGFNYIKIESATPGTPAVTLLPGDVPLGGLNYVADFELSNEQLEALTQGQDQAVVFMNLMTVGGDGIAFSHVDGAGRFLKDASHPFTIYVSSSAPGAPGTCTCSLATANGSKEAIAGSLLLSLACVLVTTGRRKHS